MPGRPAGSLAALRRAAHMTQEELAERCGLSTRAISSIESGRVERPHRRTIMVIAAALHLDSDITDRLVREYRYAQPVEAQSVEAQSAGAQSVEAQSAEAQPVEADIISAAPATLAPLAQLPAAHARFIARTQELDRLDEILIDASAGDLRIAAIHGAAGIGKTALALRWAHRARASFPDGQLYVNLQGYGPDAPIDPGTAVTWLLHSLGVPPGQVPTDIAARSAALRSLLADRRVLLLLDNARTAAQVRPLLPGSDRCGVLITSRSQLRGLSVREGAEQISLMPLSDIEAIELLGTVVAADAMAAGDIAGIVRHCAGHPLALSLVGDLLSREGAVNGVATELAAELADQRTRLSVLSAVDDDTANVRTVFSWSYRALDAEAARVFRALSLHPGPDLTAMAAAAMVGLPNAEVRAVLAALAGAHLLEAGRSGRYEFHDLIRSYAGELSDTCDSPAERQDLLTRLRQHYLDTAVAASIALDPNDAILLRHLDQPPTLTTRFGSARDALTWFDDERVNILAIAHQAAAAGAGPDVGALSDAMARYLDRSEFVADAITLHTLAVDATRDASDSAARGRAIYNLAGTSRGRGGTKETFEQLQRAAELAEESNAPIAFARAQDLLGITHCSLGQFDAAIAAHQRALQEFHRAGYEKGEGSALNNLGMVYRQMKQDTDALLHFRRALPIAQRAGDLATEGGIVNNIGLILTRLGDFQGALQQFEQALAIARDIDFREGEGFATSNVGSTYASLGRYGEAIAYLRRALRIANRCDFDVLKATAYNQLGRVSLLTGDRTRARRHYRAALTVSTEIGAHMERITATEGLAAASEPSTQETAATL